MKTDLKEISPYIYGTTRLGDDSIAAERRIEMALAAMDAGIWFHTSHQYNSAPDILRQAFDRNRSKVPPLIVKLGGNTIEEFRDDIRKNTELLGIKYIDVGQLCLGGTLAEEFATGGDCYKQFRKIKEEGRVGTYVMEVFPWTSEVPYKALTNGYSDELVDAHIFYLNPLQRFAGNALWNLLMKKNAPIIAMRTVAGGPVHKLRDVPGFAWKDYLRQRAVEVAPIFEASGIGNWPEFCVRYAHSIPQVLATVGATSRMENMNHFLTAADHPKPLPPEIMEAIGKLQEHWSDELDIHAEPWSM